jgi:acetyl-CoA synthetase
VPPSVGLSERLLNRDHHEVYHAGNPTAPDGRALRRHGDQLERLLGGYYRARGRADDTMNLGGIKVSSIELEQAIDTHPAVYESAAIAVQPDGEGADRLVVFVVPTDGAAIDESLRGELGAVIARNVSPLFKIHELVAIDALPRTASNKVMRRRLRDDYADRRK